MFPRECFDGATLKGNDTRAVHAQLQAHGLKTKLIITK
jgi:hypothetical protein